MSYLVSAQASFKDGLSTLKGSVIGKPDYGTDLPRLKHRSFNSEWVIDFRRCLKDACKHDPRLKFKSADIDSSRAGEGVISYKVYVDGFTVEGNVNV